jgi:hypothetical protein
MLADFQRTTWRYIPENTSLLCEVHLYKYEIFKKASRNSLEIFKILRNVK